MRTLTLGEAPYATRFNSPMYHRVDPLSSKTLCGLAVAQMANDEYSTVPGLRAIATVPHDKALCHLCRQADERY